jgi:hypothetical protein
MRKKPTPAKAKKPQLKVRDLKPGKEATGGVGNTKYPIGGQGTRGTGATKGA